MLQLHSIFTEVVYCADIHEDKDYYSRISRDDLQILRILNVTEAEGNTEGSKHQDGYRVYPGSVIVGALVTCDEKSDALIERLGSRYVFEAHRTVHVNNKNTHDGVFDPGSSDSVSYHA